MRVYVEALSKCDPEVLTSAPEAPSALAAWHGAWECRLTHAGAAPPHSPTLLMAAAGSAAAATTAATMGVMEEVCGEEVLDVIGAAVEAFVRRLWVGINALYDEFDKFLMQCRERLAEAEKLQPDSAPVLLLRTDIPFVLWRVMPGTAADVRTEALNAPGRSLAV